jgi:hypothetical protein
MSRMRRAGGRNRRPPWRQRVSQQGKGQRRQTTIAGQVIVDSPYRINRLQRPWATNVARSFGGRSSMVAQPARRHWCPPGYVPVVDLVDVINAKCANDAASCSAVLLERGEFGLRVARHKFCQFLTDGIIRSIGVQRGTPFIFALPSKIWSAKPVSFRNDGPEYLFEMIMGSGFLFLRVDGHDKELDIALSESDLARICKWPMIEKAKVEGNFLDLEYDKNGDLYVHSKEDASNEQARHRQPIRAKGGRPPSLFWDYFWIEVALCLSTRPDFLNDRTALQRRMREWAEEELKDDAPCESTTRRKLKLLFDKHATSTRNSGGKQN